MRSSVAIEHYLASPAVTLADVATLLIADENVRMGYETYASYSERAAAFYADQEANATVENLRVSEFITLRI